MKLADLESREVLLAKLAGAMKGSLAKAARTLDALRIKREAEEGAPAPVAAAPVEEAAVETPAVSEPEAVAEVAEVPAQDVTADVAVEAAEAPTETPAE
jgi:large subunit ribosomal protein L10